MNGSVNDPDFGEQNLLEETPTLDKFLETQRMDNLLRYRHEMQKYETVYGKEKIDVICTGVSRRAIPTIVQDKNKLNEEVKM